MQPGGLQAAALLLSALPPVVAARLVADSGTAPSGGDRSPVLLPQPLRSQLLALLPLRVRDNARRAAAEVAAAAAERSASNLAAVRAFAWGRHVTAGQLVALLRALGPGAAEDRCSAVATLWSRLVDRSNMVEVGGRTKGPPGFAVAQSGLRMYNVHACNCHAPALIG